MHSVGTLKFVMVHQYSWKGQDIQCVQPINVVYRAPAVWREQHIAGTQFQVLVDASVLELQARELCMGDVRAEFSQFSRVRLLRPPYQCQKFYASEHGVSC
jgi:hypothetical protein